MPEPSPAQGTLKRLIEAEDQAREILKAAGQSAQDAIAQAGAQARQSVDAVRQRAAGALESRLREAESKSAAEMKQRMQQADAEAQEFERRAAQHFSQAVDMVVDWVATEANDLSLFSYAGAQGFIRARLSRLLDRPTWARLLEAATPAELNGSPAPTLRAEVAEAGSTLVRFLPRGAAELVAWYNRRYEIENLKTVLRAVHYGMDRPAPSHP